MKVICLHDKGQNQEQFRADIDSLLRRLQKSNKGLLFDFINAPLPDSVLLKIDPPTQLVESHHFKFYGKDEAKDIQKACEWLASKLESNGPYDGVIAFSQGAVLVASFLLYRQWYDHELPPAFKFAIFIGGGLSLKVLKDIGVLVSKEAETAISQATLQHDQGLGPLPAHMMNARRAVFNSDDCFGLNLNKMPLELKIRIPTVHIWGENDPLFPSSIHLAGLCDPYIRKIYTHSGRREIPQGDDELAEIVPLVEWCMQRGSWPGQTQL
ncbi:serine hydrolase FSH [Rostrohypoxylon terebratum]|nr:serine hydrolase FSH [Rostrohypoxylon terebratum]